MGSRDLLLEFWDPSISRQRLMLELHIWHTDWPLGVLTKKCKIRSKGVLKGSRDLIYAILGPPPSRLVTGGTNKKCKIRSLGVSGVT